MKAFCSILCGVVATGAAFTPLLAANAKPAAAKPTVSAKVYDEHVVKRGETLWSIAQTHNTSVGEVMDYNRLSNETVREGVKLKIPHRVAAEPRSIRQHIHVVEEGETLWTIADDYGVSSEGLAKANPNVNPNRIQANMELVIPAEEPGAKPLEEKAKVTAAPAKTTAPTKESPGTKGGTHTVAEGETFYSIGKKHGVTSEALVAANPDVKPERLRSGMQVIIPGASKGKAASTAPNVSTASPPPQRSGSASVLHTVREKESVSSIAKKYGVREEPLMKLNRLNSRDKLHPGDILTIPGGNRTPAPRVETTAPVQKTSLAASPPASPPKTVASKTVPAPAPTPKKVVPSTPSPSPSTSPPAAASPPKKEGGPVQSYIVSAGENEQTIAEAFGISKQQLYEYNRLDSSTSLRAGDEIMIPARK